MTLSSLILLWTISYTYAMGPLCSAGVCVCEDLIVERQVKLDCSRAYLAIIPPVDDWPSNITHMDLSTNNISAIDFQIGILSVEELDLSNNRIDSVVQNAFGGLRNLRYLNLANNKIKQFNENGFYGLDHLRSLNISSNGLNNLPDQLFYHFINLEELSLANNPLAHLNIILFNRLINLKWLDVSNTDLYVLPASIFHTTGQLNFLDLSANDFHEVPTNALRSAKSLRHLRLSENEFEVFDKNSFVKLTTLEVLEVNNMEHLREVREGTFSHLTRLRVLEMKYNRHLTLIDRNAFYGLFNTSRPVLQELDLEANNLRSMDGNTVPCAKLRKFNVQRNPWICDCSFRWIKFCELQKIYEADLKCADPENLSGALVVFMTPDELECRTTQSELFESIRHHESVVRSVSLGLAAGLLVILAFGLGVIFKWKDIRAWYRKDKRRDGAVYYVRARTGPRENRSA